MKLKLLVKYLKMSLKRRNGTKLKVMNNYTRRLLNHRFYEKFCKRHVLENRKNKPRKSLQNDIWKLLTNRGEKHIVIFGTEGNGEKHGEEKYIKLHKTGDKD